MKNRVETGFTPLFLAHNFRIGRETMTDQLMQYIAALTPYVRRIYEGDPTGHDENHAWQTLHYAWIISHEEKIGNPWVFVPAALLHDVHRRYSWWDGRPYDAGDLLWPASDVLNQIKYPIRHIEEILFCIGHHDWPDISSLTNSSGHNDLRLVQDADRLMLPDIQRLIAWSEAYGVPAYDPDNLDPHQAVYKPKNGETSLGYLHKIALPTLDLFHTQTARKYAEKLYQKAANLSGLFVNSLYEAGLPRPLSLKAMLISLTRDPHTILQPEDLIINGIRI